jgi:predicted nucleic acid-binding protein
MTVVVDASVALKWFVKEENTPLAVALLASGERAIAPKLHCRPLQCSLAALAPQ